MPKSITSFSGFKDQFLSKLNKFSQSDKEVFDRMYKVWETRGRLNPPKEMYEWIEKTFGSVDLVKEQNFLKITNIITFEGSIFNELRTKRPIIGDDKFAETMAEVEAVKGGPFEHPLTGTPADVFGRVKGRYCVTAANIAKYDGMHGLIIFKDHNPLLFSRKRVTDYFEVAQKWFKKANVADGKAIYPMYTWNCLWRAGASIIHGHSQLVLTGGQAYAKVEEFRHLTLKYQETCKNNYFDDIYYIHERLGLGFSRGNTRVLVKITPIKEKEIMILGQKFDSELAMVVSDVLNNFKERLGVTTFNLSVVLPPMSETPEVWSHMPVIVRVVDRGKLSSRTADVGVMELYAQSIIESNPYTVHTELRKALMK